MKVLK